MHAGSTRPRSAAAPIRTEGGRGVSIDERRPDTRAGPTGWYEGGKHHLVAAEWVRGEFEYPRRKKNKAYTM